MKESLATSVKGSPYYMAPEVTLVQFREFICIYIFFNLKMLICVHRSCWSDSHLDVGLCRYCYQGETNVLMGWQWISGVLAVLYLKWQMASPHGVAYKGWVILAFSLLVYLTIWCWHESNNKPAYMWRFLIITSLHVCEGLTITEVKACNFSFLRYCFAVRILFQGNKWGVATNSGAS